MKAYLEKIWKKCKEDFQQDTLEEILKELLKKCMTQNLEEFPTVSSEDFLKKRLGELLKEFWISEFMKIFLY